MYLFVYLFIPSVKCMPGTFIDTWDMASNNKDKNITVIECTDKCISEIYTRSNGYKLYIGEINQRGGLNGRSFTCCFIAHSFYG